MKTMALPKNTGIAALALSCIAAAAMMAPLALRAQTVHSITSSTTIINEGNAGFTVAASSTTIFEIANGMTLAFLQTGNVTTSGGMYNITNTSPTGDTLFKIGPDTPGGTGWAVFDGISSTASGGVFYISGVDGGSVTLDITNATFINNKVTANNAVGGVFQVQSNIYSLIYLTNVLVQNNWSESVAVGNGAGVVRNNSVFVVTNGTFFGNYALIGSSGVIDTNSNNSPHADFTNVLFDSNRAAQNAGVMKSRSPNNTGYYTSTNSIFVNNWAGGYGGVAYNDYNANNASAGFFFNYTTAGGTNNYTFSGNGAGYSASGSATPNEVRNNAPLGQAQAKAGGFLFTNQNGRTTFNIDSGVTLNIGDAGATDKALDSIASGTNLARLDKNGAGTLILNADNSYYSGTFMVNANGGRLLLGNTGAQLGGTIIVANGATFGGFGTLQTFNQAGVAQATLVTFRSGATLQVGTDNATTGQRLAFTRTGANSLVLEGGVTLKFDLHGSDGTNPASYDQIIADQLAASTGINTLDLTGLGAGTYTLISAASFTGDETNFDYLINGGALTARNTVNLQKSGNDLLLHSTLSNLALAWTGADSALWTNINVLSPNWTDSGANAEKYFRPGDHVTFNGVDDTAFPASRAIAIAAEGVTVSGIAVTGPEDYTFSGGAVTVDASSAQTGFTGTTGILEKSGAGTLTLANTANNFSRITLAEGALAFSSAAQLGSGANDIRFTGDATLHATNTTAISLSNKITVDAGKTATLDITGAPVTYNGDLSGVASTAALVKTGAGMLSLSGDYSTLAPTVTTLVSDGALRLSTATARLGGAVTIVPGASLGGIGEYTGPVIAQAGSTLHIGTANANTGQTLTINSLTLQGATLQFDLFDDLTADHLIIGSLASLAGTSTIDIGQYKSGSRVIATINTGDLAALGALQVTIGGMAQSGARQVIVLSTSGNTLIANGTGDISRAMTWTGTGATPTQWDSSTANWTGSGDTITFAGGDRVSFDDSSDASTHTITIGGLRALVSDMIVTGTSNYTFTGGAIVADAGSVITATGSANLTGATAKLLKNGTGTLTLANDSANDFMGGIDLRGGALVLASAGASGTSAITVNTTGAGARIAAGIDGLQLANSIALTTAADTLTLDTQGNSISLTGAITGAGALTITGNGAGGAATLGGNNTFTGNITLTGGTLGLAHANALGAANKTLAITGPGATLQWQTDAVNITQTITATDGFLADTLDNSATISGNISTTGPITKTGAGTLTLSGSNTALTGALAITEGRLIATSLNALGGPAATGVLDIATGASLDIAITPAAASGTFELARALSGAGALNVSLAATTDEFRFFTNTSAAFTGALYMHKGTLRLDENAAVALDAPTSNLLVGADAVVQKAGAAFTINRLTLDGGRLNVAITNGVPGAQLLTVTTLDTGTGVTKIGVDSSQFATGDQHNPAIPPAANLLDQGGHGNTLLVAAGATTGSGDVQLTALDGSMLPASHATITQTGPTAATTGTIATATYSYGASVKADGIYMGYGLTQLDINEGKTLILDNRGAANSTLDAVLAGSGGVEVSATGILTLAKQNTLTGATTIASGTLRAGTGQVLAQSSALEIASGAAFNLNGHAQTIQNLSGAGAVLIGTSTLTVHNTADTAFSGALSGAGRLIKQGGGKLLLDGANTHGSTEIAAGTLGVGAAGALGAATSAITVTGTGAALHVDTAGLTIANPINMGTNGFAIATNTGASEFTGIISGASKLTVEGSGTTTLSGVSTFSGGVNVTAPRVIAKSRVNAIGTGPVTLAPGSTLEYRGIASGNANNAITGGGIVEVFSSTMGFGGANNLSRLRIGAGSSVTASNTAALGGAASTVEVSGGGTLTIATPGTLAQNLSVGAGGKIVFSNISFVQASLKLAGPAAFDNNTTIALASEITGQRTLIETPSLTGFDNVTFDPGPNATGSIDYRNGKLYATLINMAANPGKDIATAYDAMTASTKAVYSRVSEAFLVPVAEKQDGLWAKVVASFADYGGDTTKIGYREDTFGLLAGFDARIGENTFWGFYGGHSTISVRTVNDATNDGKLPYAGLYLGGYLTKTVYAVADIMAGTLKADTHRLEQDGHVIGTYKASMYGGTLEVGTVMKSWDTGVIRPSFSLHYLGASYNDQNESGDTPFYIDDFKARRFEAFANVHIAQQFTTCWNRPGYFDLSVGWRASLTNDQTKLSASFSRTTDDRFDINCDKYRRGGLVAGLGLRVMVGRTSMLGLSYDYEVSPDIERHTLNATLRWAW